MRVILLVEVRVDVLGNAFLRRFFPKVVESEPVTKP